MRDKGRETRRDNGIISVSTWRKTVATVIRNTREGMLRRKRTKVSTKYIFFYDKVEVLKAFQLRNWDDLHDMGSIFFNFVSIVQSKMQNQVSVLEIRQRRTPFKCTGKRENCFNVSLI